MHQSVCFQVNVRYSSQYVNVFPDQAQRFCDNILKKERKEHYFSKVRLTVLRKNNDCEKAFMAVDEFSLKCVRVIRNSDVVFALGQNRF